MVIDPNYKKVKICEDIRDERIEIERSIEFNGKYIIIKSLSADDIRNNDSGKLKNAIMKEIYISSNLQNSKVYVKEYKINIWKYKS